jgi:uncharacterized protein (TIRG00374 family)
MHKLLSNFLNYTKINRKKIFIILLSFIMGAVLFASIFFYVDYKDLARNIFQFKWWKFAIFVAVSIFNLFITTYRWSIVLKSYNIKVSFWRLYQYRLAGFGFSYLTPIAELGGAPFRAYLLQKEGVKFNKGLLTIIIDNFLDIFTQSIIAAFGMALFISHLGLSTKASWLFGVATAFFIGLMGWFYIRLRKGQPVIAPLFKFLRLKKIYIKIKRVEEPFVSFFKNHKRAFFKAIGMSLFAFIMTVLEIGVLLYLMGHFIGIFNTFFAKVILNISNLFPVPAALGVSEWAQSAFFDGILHDKSTGLTFSLLFKAKNMFYALIGIGLFMYWWHKRVRWDKRLINGFKEKINGKKLI